MHVRVHRPQVVSFQLKGKKNEMRGMRTLKGGAPSLLDPHQIESSFAAMSLVAIFDSVCTKFRCAAVFRPCQLLTSRYTCSVINKSECHQAHAIDSCRTHEEHGWPQVPLDNHEIVISSTQLHRSSITRPSPTARYAQSYEVPAPIKAIRPMRQAAFPLGSSQRWRLSPSQLAGSHLMYRALSTFSSETSSTGGASESLGEGEQGKSINRLLDLRYPASW